MTLEQQVISLELAKRLKELGVKQESLFYWSLGESKNEVFFFENETPFSTRLAMFSAFTVAELGELLPNELYDELSGFFVNLKIEAWYGDSHGGWYVEYGDMIVQEDVKMADAMAKMLIYLIENKLIEL